MVTGSLLSDDLILPEHSVRNAHPMDSSRLLVGLMMLSHSAQKSRQEGPDSDSLDGVISKGLLRSLLSALHFRDVNTIRHSRRVAMLAIGMAQYLGWEGRHLRLLEVAALLHDVGKIGVPDNILFKPGKLSPDEAELMALHYNIGIDVIQACRVDHEVLDMVVQSHSHYNGAGDCYRRIGSEVHQGARILSVADAYDSMATEQVYRPGKTHDEVMEVLSGSAGTQFDGNIISALSRWVDADGVPFSQATPGVGAAPSQQPAANREDTLEASSLCHIFSYLYLLESLYDGFYLVDAQMRFVVWNRGAESLLEHSAKEMLGQTCDSGILKYSDKYGTRMPDHERPLKQVMETGKPATWQVQIQHRDGKWMPIELQCVPLVDRHGRFQGVAEIFRDLSRNNRRPQEYRELKLQASRDALTGVANRGELETQMALMISEFSQSENAEPLSAISLDVDHFKSINDTLGHTKGDQVLVELAKLLQHETYSGELVGRYGGEEFVVLCPGTGIEQASKRAERLRLAICGSTVGHLEDRRVTASFGVAEIEAGDSVESLLRRADKALYMSKTGGRNRVTSLTNGELRAGEEKAKQVEDEATDKLLFTGTFQACIAAEMVVYKLGGFVNDYDAKLLDVTPHSAALRVGSRGVLPFWGGSEERQPVELHIQFDEAPTGEQKQRGASSRVGVTVRILPVGWVRNPVVFHTRAKNVFKELRSFFVAE